MDKEVLVPVDPVTTKKATAKPRANVKALEAKIAELTKELENAHKYNESVFNTSNTMANQLNVVKSQLNDMEDLAEASIKTAQIALNQIKALRNFLGGNK